MKWVKNPDEIVLEDVKMFHLENMDTNALWVGVYTQDNKIYHLKIVAKDNQLNYFWSDETVEKPSQDIAQHPRDAL